MKIYKLTLGRLAANCYIVRLKNISFIVDPGAEASVIERFLGSNSIKPDMIINTHGHFDHIGAVEEIVKNYGIPFYIDPDEEETVTDPLKNGSSFFGENNLSLKTYNLINGDDIEYFNENGIYIIKTPGHSPGSITLKIENTLFTGDLIFKGSIGRTDLVGGDIQQMKKSLLKIKRIDKNFIINPGHGPETDLKYEKENNYYLRDSIIGS
jgi:hydroxyacylglutathione hydrolase